MDKYNDPEIHSAQATRAANARKASGRRRGVDPTTTDRQYTLDEVEFMNAMQAYKDKSRRLFPTHSETLEVLISLGYRKASPSNGDQCDAQRNGCQGQDGTLHVLS